LASRHTDIRLIHSHTAIVDGYATPRARRQRRWLRYQQVRRATCGALDEGGCCARAAIGMAVEGLHISRLLERQ